jgi:hypothetical protein
MQPIPEPTPAIPSDVASENPWAPFQDRLAFDWARYHYVRLQSSADDIQVGLDLWRAAVIKHASDHDSLEGVPWDNAEQLYATIDSIYAGEIGWKTLKFSYSGPKPSTPPHWMEQTYDLNLRDVLGLLEQQLASTEFAGQFEYAPFQEFDFKGDRVYSHLMSAFWANREAVCSLVRLAFHAFINYCRIRSLKILKRMVPCLYLSSPEVIKLLCRLLPDTRSIILCMRQLAIYQTWLAEGMAMQLCRLHFCLSQRVRQLSNLYVSTVANGDHSASKRQRKKPEFQKFCHQLYHLCLEAVFEPLRPYMMKPKVVRCPDGHFRRAIFSLGPYIADYPEQVWLACVVYHWCPK